MTKEVYIGARSSKNIATIIGNNPPRLNGKMSEHLRGACMQLGIKKSEQGKKLEFFVVDEDQYTMLTDHENQVLEQLKGNDPVHHLVKVDKEQLGKIIDQVNAKSEYKGGMDYSTYEKYKRDMSNSLKQCVEVTGKDLNIKKTPDKKPENPYKVGDLVLLGREYDSPYSDGKYASHRVAKDGKLYIELEAMRPSQLEGCGVWSNSVSAKECFNNVETYGNIKDQYANHGHFIPFEGNEASMHWLPLKQRRMWDNEQTKPVKIIWTDVASWDYNAKTHTKQKIDQDAKIGYVYDWRPSWN